MLPALVLVFCSASAAMVENTVKLNPLHVLLSQANYLPAFKVRNPQAEVVSGITRPSYENCPANRVLQKIEMILLKVLNEEYDRNLALKRDNTMNTLTSEAEKLVLPLSKINSLKDLLDNNNLQNKVRTKVTVKYELPSIEDLSCKQALNQILQVLQEANLMQEYSRTCGPKDKCPRENVVDIKNDGNNNVLNTAINQGNNYAPSNFATLDTEPNSVKVNDGSESKQELNSLKKYLLSNKSKNIMDLLNNYKTSEQLSLLNDTVSKQLLEKFNVQSGSVSDSITNLPANNIFTYQQLLNPPKDTINQNTNISDIIAQALLYDTNAPGQIDLNVAKNPDSLIVTGTSDANVASLLPPENGKNIQIDVANGGNTITNINTGLPENNVLTSNTETQKQQSITNIIGSFSDNLNNNVQNVSNNNILSILDPVKQGADYNKLVSSILQYQVNNQQTQPQQTIDPKNQGSQPNYVNSNLVMNGGNYLPPNMGTYTSGSLYQRPYQIGTSYSTYYTNGGIPYRFPNVNPLNNNPQTLNNQKMLYQTSYVNSNPFLGNPKLLNNIKQVGQQFYAPHNLVNPQRFAGVTDQSKLNFATDNNGIVELTYMLKQPNPVVYQPVYFVKYRLPYDSFVNNLKELLMKKPHLRTDPAKLYQELIAVSKIAEVSPSLKGVGKEKLTQMVATNGALIKTKVLKVNETLLDKQLETVQNLNSILAPNEIVNMTYSVQVNANKLADNPEKSNARSEVADSNEMVVKYIDDVLKRDKNLEKTFDAVNTNPPFTQPLQNHGIPNFATIR